MNKHDLRSALRKLRDSAPPAQRAASDSVIFKRLMADANLRAASTVMTYVSMGSEPDTHRLINALLSAGKRVAVPVVRGRALDISYTGALDDLESGSYGILEPKKRCFSPCSPSAPDVIIVPGLGFDKSGHRIGYGAGFYDRLLPQMSGVKIGVCRSLCMVADVFPEPHDVRVGYIITDSDA